MWAESSCASTPPRSMWSARCSIRQRGTLRLLPERGHTGKNHTFCSSQIGRRGLRNAPPYLSFRSCPKRKTAPRPGLRAAAAGGRKRRPGISAAAPFVGCREAGPQRAMRQGGGRKKRARARDKQLSFDTQYARLPNLGANCIQEGNLFAPVSAEGFAYARAAACAGNRY